MRHNGTFIFYHRAKPEIAQTILQEGFKNSSGDFLTNKLWTGVWLSSVPAEKRNDEDDAVNLMVKFEATERELLSRWEWTAEGRPYREWLIPAALLNKRASVEMVDQMEFSTVAA